MEIEILPDWEDPAIGRVLGDPVTQDSIERDNKRQLVYTFLHSLHKADHYRNQLPQPHLIQR